MAQKAHVPKFGNWESDNVPYTTFFDNARKGKGAGTRMINPNDPEENPDAFPSGIFPQQYKFANQQQDDGSYDFGIRNVVSVSPKKTPNRGKPYEKDKELDSDDSFGFQGFMRGSSPQNFSNQRADSDQKGARMQKSSNSDSGNEKMRSDTALLSQNRHFPAVSSPEPSYMYSPPRQTTLKTGTNVHREGNHNRAASVPKFGAWDETDPKSGEGFTIIFNKVKEEKQTTATRLPTTAPSEQKITRDARLESNSSSLLLKICCCHPSSS